jgi:hypothetical protein
MGFPPEKQEGAPNISELSTAATPPDGAPPSSSFFKLGTVLDHFEIVLGPARR